MAFRGATGRPGRIKLIGSKEALKDVKVRRWKEKNWQIVLGTSPWVKQQHAKASRSEKKEGTESQNSFGNLNLDVVLSLSDSRLVHAPAVVDTRNALLCMFSEFHGSHFYYCLICNVQANLKPCLVTRRVVYVIYLPMKTQSYRDARNTLTHLFQSFCNNALPSKNIFWYLYKIRFHSVFQVIIWWKATSFQMCFFILEKDDNRGGRDRNRSYRIKATFSERDCVVFFHVRPV